MSRKLVHPKLLLLAGLLGVLAAPRGPARAQPSAAAPSAKAKSRPAGKSGKPTPGVAGAVKAGPSGKALAPAEIDKLAADLTSGDDKLAGDAARTLAEDGSPKAMAPMLEVLSIGTFPRLLPAMLGALGKFKHPDALPMLVLYSSNRSPKARVAAINALSGIEDEKAAGVLHERLGDPEAEVRTAAADACAQRKDGRVVDTLFTLLAKNDAGVAAALGQLAPLDMVTKVAELRGLIGDSGLATALGEFLKRPGAPDRLRLDLVRTIGALPGADATTALVEYLGSLPEKENPPSKVEAQTLIDQRGAQ